MQSGDPAHWPGRLGRKDLWAAAMRDAIAEKLPCVVT